MIDEIYMIERDSGLTLFYLNFKSKDSDSNTSPDLFGGALQGIRMLLKECKIGELNEFTTHEHRIEMRCDSTIFAVIVADLNDPPHETLDMMAEDILVLFSNTYRDFLTHFSGETRQFEPFKGIVKDYIKLQLHGEGEENLSIRGASLKEKAPVSTSKTTGGLDPKINLLPLIDWLKNRYDSKATIQTDMKIYCHPGKDELLPSIGLFGGERKLSRIDRWMAGHVGKPNYEEVFLIFGLNPSHGPETIREILEKAQNLGDPAFNSDKTVFPWFPIEILFIGPAIQPSTFARLDDMIKNYKDETIIVPNYTDHIHREHSPHHAFYRCRISGWQWKVGTLTHDNYPKQVFPHLEM